MGITAGAGGVGVVDEDIDEAEVDVEAPLLPFAVVVVGAGINSWGIGSVCMTSFCSGFTANHDGFSS